MTGFLNPLHRKKLRRSQYYWWRLCASCVCPPLSIIDSHQTLQIQWFGHICPYVLQVLAKSDLMIYRFWRKQTLHFIGFGENRPYVLYGVRDIMSEQGEQELKLQDWDFDSGGFHCQRMSINAPKKGLFLCRRIRKSVICIYTLCVYVYIYICVYMCVCAVGID